jgi:hypothetical protein
MSNEPPDVSFSDLINAFLHPPRLLPIGQRHESDDGVVSVLSHLELWPWRVILRGARADPNAEDESVRHLTTLPQQHDDGPVGISIGVLEPEHRGRNRAVMEWTTAWLLADDLGTDYRIIGASTSGGLRRSDFEVTFEPQMPPNAKRVTITTPDGDAVEVAASID